MTPWIAVALLVGLLLGSGGTLLVGSVIGHRKRRLLQAQRPGKPKPLPGQWWNLDGVGRVKICVVGKSVYYWVNGNYNESHDAPLEDFLSQAHIDYEPYKGELKLLQGGKSDAE